MIVVIDTETTGTDRQRDQIIELALQFGISWDASRVTYRMKPSIAIPAEATEIHGITDADVADLPPFLDAASGDLGFLSYLNVATVIVGYGVAFDLEILQAELARAGLPPLDLSRKVLIDAMRLWQYFEPRTLVAAHQKFCGFEVVNAHSAGADVAATGRVLEAMRSQFGCVSLDWDALAELCDPMPERHNWIGPTHHIQWMNGRAAFAVGQHKGAALSEIPRDYLQWVCRKDFPPHVKDICNALLTMSRDEAGRWFLERYPRPTAKAA